MRHPTLRSAILVSLLAAGCSGKGGASAKKVDVAGRVLDYSDQPIAGAQVLVGSTLVTTDASGNFSATGVAVPYSLVLNDSPVQQVVAYLGVTRNDPVLRSGGGSLNARSAQLSGTITPTGGSELGYTSITQYNFLNSGLTPNGLDSFNFTQNWYGAASIPGHLASVRFTRNAQNIVNSITGLGGLDLTLNDATPQSGLTVPLSVPATGTANATAQIPAGFSLNGLFGSAVGPAGAVLGLGVTTSLSASFVTIADTGYQTEVAVSAAPTGGGQDSGSSFAYKIVAPTSTTVIQVPGLPVLTAPAATSTVSKGVTISWTQTVATDSARVQLIPEATGPTVLVIVPPGKTSFKFPDLTAFGLPTTPSACKLSVLEDDATLSTDDRLAQTPPTATTTRTAFGAATVVTLEL